MNRTIFPRFIWIGALLSAFVFYLWVCQDFVTGKTSINMDTMSLYVFMKYFMNNVFNGVVPHWEPFVFAGRPFLGLLNQAMLHPLMHISFLTVFLGFSYYQAFLCFILLNYFLGVLGFFFLSRLLLKDSAYATLSSVALLFSGMGLMIFNQYYILLIFVPSVWFFFFLMRFVREYRVADFFGIFFSLMIMEISYYPFYLLTVFLAVTLFYVLYNFVNFKIICRNIWSFCHKHKIVVVVCLTGLMITAMPLIMYKFKDAAGEIIAPSRHFDCNLKNNVGPCFENSQLKLLDVVPGSLAERVSFSSLFSHLDKINIIDDSVFFVPIFCLAVIFISLFLPLSRAAKVFLFSGFAVFIVAMGVTTPVESFLFKHGFYFKYFRNFFFFMAFLIPMIILFSMMQLKVLVEHLANFGMRTVIIVIGLLLILASIAQLQGPNLGSSYLTLALAGLLFIFFVFFRRKELTPFYFISLLILIVIQPLEVYLAYQSHAAAGKPLVASSHTVPVFTFDRPEKIKKYDYMFRDFNFEALLKMKDSYDAFIRPPGAISRWFLLGVLYMKSGTMDQFIRHKFYLYNKVDFYNKEDKEILKDLEQRMIDHSDATYAFDDQLPRNNIKQMRMEQEGGVNQAQIIDASSVQLKVKHFDVNRIDLIIDLDHPKFLVYTDNFTNDWQALMDGKVVKIYRAGLAFKGVVLPAGKHSLSLVYHPPGIFIYGLIAIVVLIFSITVVVLFLRKRSNIAKPYYVQLSQEKIEKGFKLINNSAFYYLFICFLSLMLINPLTLHEFRKNHLYLNCFYSTRPDLDKIVYSDYLRLIGEKPKGR